MRDRVISSPLDAEYIDAGKIHTVSQNNLNQRYETLRSFPDGTRIFSLLNCAGQTAFAQSDFAEKLNWNNDSSSEFEQGTESGEKRIFIFCLLTHERAQIGRKGRWCKMEKEGRGGRMRKKERGGEPFPPLTHAWTRVRGGNHSNWLSTNFTTFFLVIIAHHLKPSPLLNGLKDGSCWNYCMGWTYRCFVHGRLS